MLVCSLVVSSGCIPSATSTPVLPCREIQDAFSFEYVPDATGQLEARLIAYLNDGLFPEPQAIVEPTDGLPYLLLVRVEDRSDITGDSIPEIFLTAASIPGDQADMTGMFTSYVILNCTGGQYQNIHTSTYQTLYHQYETVIEPDSNGNGLPEVMITDTNSHFETTTHSVMLEWDGRSMAFVEETFTTPTPST